MNRMLPIFGAAALALSLGVAGQAAAAAPKAPVCKDAHGKVVKCPTKAPAATKSMSSAQSGTMAKAGATPAKTK